MAPGSGFVLVTCSPGSPPQPASKPQPWVASVGNSPTLLGSSCLAESWTSCHTLLVFSSSNKCPVAQSRAGDVGETRSYCWGLGWKRGLSYCPTSSSLPQGSLPRAPHRPPPAPSRHLGLPSLIRLRRDPLDMGSRGPGRCRTLPPGSPQGATGGKTE